MSPRAAHVGATPGDAPQGRNDTRLGILLMVATTMVFAAQDGLSRHLASNYNVLMVVMLRYWFFAAFVIVVAARRAGGLRAAAATAHPALQAARGLLLAAEICTMVLGFVLLGLVESHAVFTCYPLLIAALSGPILRERVGWRRWAAIATGFVGVLVILQPGVRVFQPEALVPLAAATMFALYGLLTRYVSRRDGAATSFFWTGCVGCVALTLVGISFWEPMLPGDWAWMGLLCVTGAFGPLAAHQGVRDRRGECRAAVRLPAAGVRRDDRPDRLRRDAGAQRPGRRRHRGRGGPLHAGARAAGQRATRSAMRPISPASPLSRAR